MSHPAELRLKTYACSFATESTFPPPLSAVSKRIRQESLPLFYQRQDYAFQDRGAQRAETALEAEVGGEH